MKRKLYNANCSSISPICGNCMYWDQEHGVLLPNPEKRTRLFLPELLYAPCRSPFVVLTDREDCACLQTCQGNCADCGEGFEPSEDALWDAREYRDQSEMYDDFSEDAEEDFLGMDISGLDMPELLTVPLRQSAVRMQ